MNAIDNAYAPYSDFKVGACIELADGQYITGSNVENASYGLSNCAERSAIFAAYSKGYRKEDIKAMAITTHAEKLTMPCGACRQVLSELLLPDTPILIANDKEEKNSHHARTSTIQLRRRRPEEIINNLIFLSGFRIISNYILLFNE